jgi:hypothetical protein
MSPSSRCAVTCISCSMCCDMLSVLSMPKAALPYPLHRAVLPTFDLLAPWGWLVSCGSAMQALPNLMPGFDKEIAKLAQRVLINPRNIDYHTGVLATKVTPGTLLQGSLASKIFVSLACSNALVPYLCGEFPMLSFRGAWGGAGEGGAHGFQDQGACRHAGGGCSAGRHRARPLHTGMLAGAAP